MRVAASTVGPPCYPPIVAAPLRRLPAPAPPVRLYTVGYARLAPARLDALLDELCARLVDVRVKPWSRIPGWSRPDLARRYGERYLWRGDLLGGLGRTTWPEGIAWLAAASGPLVLLCKEDSPLQCHRHGIALGLDEPVDHWYRERLYRADGLDELDQEDEIGRQLRLGV